MRRTSTVVCRRASYDKNLGRDKIGRLVWIRVVDRVIKIGVEWLREEGSGKLTSTQRSTQSR
jgi:hypothetical protein